MRKWIFGIMLLIVVATACSPTGKMTHKGPIRIGVIAPLTGEAASYGIASKKGLDLAMHEINRKGGIAGRQLQFVYQDSANENTKAVQAMKKFIYIDDMDIVIVADGSGATMAVAPLADATKTMMIATLGSTPELTDQGDYVFRTVPSDAAQGKKLAQLADAYDTVAVLYVNGAYGVGIDRVFKKSTSARIVAEENFPSGATDMRTQITKIQAKDPDAILIVAHTELPAILKQIQELGIDADLLASETAKNPELIAAAGSSAEGLQTVFYAETQDYANYATKFEAYYGETPTLYGDYSYDAVYALAAAIEDAGSTDATALKDAMYSVEIRGATGIVRFDADGEVQDKPFDTYTVRHGELVLS